MKHHIPTEQYGFTEIDGEMTYEEAKAMVIGKIGSGLEDKEWNKCLDKYLAGNGLESAEYEGMDSKQQWCIQQLKKAFKRKNNEN